MFFDSEAWPPPPDGFDPPSKPEPRLSAVQERIVMRGVGLLLLGLFVGPLAGSSVLVPVVALVRMAMTSSQVAHAGAGLRPHAAP